MRIRKTSYQTHPKHKLTSQHHTITPLHCRSRFRVALRLNFLLQAVGFILLNGGIVACLTSSESNNEHLQLNNTINLIKLSFPSIRYT
ncbi:hypothetical protein H5410_055792 [Solanum commersonii]|uniref:Uncharacterized protein n=1 Tax=Solanum commersonii TaxID=4109 RepID=A0A9J5WJD2_SOLCO|nr:hypothetical protein H5410_055792 [Solanum commersonii]